MKILIAIFVVFISLQACTVARVAGGAAVGAGQLALGTADLVL